jgi:hypothetical protein
MSFKILGCDLLNLFHNPLIRDDSQFGNTGWGIANNIEEQGT